eukprot:COSAG05_NODE_1333_length_5152_cov_4.935484_5_plen_68_part_00
MAEMRGTQAGTVDKFKAVLEARASDPDDEFVITKAGTWMLDVDLEQLGGQQVFQTPLDFRNFLDSGF